MRKDVSQRELLKIHVHLSLWDFCCLHEEETQATRRICVRSIRLAHFLLYNSRGRWLIWRCRYASTYLELSIHFYRDRDVSASGNMSAEGSMRVLFFSQCKGDTKRQLHVLQPRGDADFAYAYFGISSLRCMHGERPSYMWWWCRYNTINTRVFRYCREEERSSLRECCLFSSFLGASRHLHAGILFAVGKHNSMEKKGRGGVRRRRRCQMFYLYAERRHIWNSCSKERAESKVFPVGVVFSSAQWCHRPCVLSVTIERKKQFLGGSTRGMTPAFLSR